MSTLSSKILPRLFIILACLLISPGFANAQDCTPAEVQRIITFSNQMIYILQSGDFQQLVNKSMELNNSLSQSCQMALMRAQRANPYGGGRYQGGVPNVYDHGGGTYSVPNIGSCGPSGCMAFD